MKPTDYNALVQMLMGQNALAQPAMARKPIIGSVLGTEGARAPRGGGSRAVPREPRSPEEATELGYRAFELGVPKGRAPEAFRDHWLGGWEQGRHFKFDAPPED
jgi:ribosome modulation factor